MLNGGKPLSLLSKETIYPFRAPKILNKLHAMQSRSHRLPQGTVACYDLKIREKGWMLETIGFLRAEQKEKKEEEPKTTIKIKKPKSILKLPKPPPKEAADQATVVHQV